MKIKENKIRHIHNVAEYMYEHAEKYNIDPEVAYTIGLLHDIGYIRCKEGHAEVGADLLDNMQFRYSNIIRYHGITPNNYMSKLNCSKDNIPKELKLLWEADMHVDSKGNQVSFDERLRDIKERYGKNSTQYKTSSEIVAWLMEERTMENSIRSFRGKKDGKQSN